MHVVLKTDRRWPLESPRGSPQAFRPPIRYVSGSNCRTCRHNLLAGRTRVRHHEALVVVGYPKGIKYENFKGNGKARLRRTLVRWTYGREICYIREECAKQGIPSEAPDERWSSRTCHRCGSRHTERLTQSIFHCWNCELIYNADYNSSINIGSRFLPRPRLDRPQMIWPMLGMNRQEKRFCCAVTASGRGVAPARHEFNRKAIHPSGRARTCLLSKLFRILIDRKACRQFGQSACQWHHVLS